MEILLTGAGGQLGLELQELLPARGHGVAALTRSELDIADARAVEEAVGRRAPDLVVNAAAYTDVDGCETERETAYGVNALGPRNLAVSCERAGCALLHVSTNYVFGGEQDAPYAPYDPPHPRSVYARTKLAGEDLVRDLCSRWYVVRSAGVYGEGHNFVRTMLRVGRERDHLKVKDDEYISPTYARDLAGAVIEIAESGLFGLYHAANSGSCSWHEFTREIFRLCGTTATVEPIPASEYPLPAPRPANGVLSTLGAPQLRPWQEALEDYLDRTGELAAG